jgi:hypothetical protein
MACDCSAYNLNDFPKDVDGVFECANAVPSDANATAGGDVKYNGITVIDTVESKFTSTFILSI